MAPATSQGDENSNPGGRSVRERNDAPRLDLQREEEGYGEGEAAAGRVQGLVVRFEGLSLVGGVEGGGFKLTGSEGGGERRILAGQGGSGGLGGSAGREGTAQDGSGGSIATQGYGLLVHIANSLCLFAVKGGIEGSGTEGHGEGSGVGMGWMNNDGGGVLDGIGVVGGKVVNDGGFVRIVGRHGEGGRLEAGRVVNDGGGGGSYLGVNSVWKLLVLLLVVDEGHNPFVRPHG